MGMPTLEAIRTVSAEPISMQKPLKYIANFLYIMYIIDNAIDMVTFSVFPRISKLPVKNGSISGSASRRVIGIPENFYGDCTLGLYFENKSLSQDKMGPGNGLHTLQNPQFWHLNHQNPYTRTNFRVNLENCLSKRGIFKDCPSSQNVSKWQFARPKWQADRWLGNTLVTLTFSLKIRNLLEPPWNVTILSITWKMKINLVVI